MNHLHIDGHLLQLLLKVLETGSVTRAAEHLQVSQSAVSHMLDRLRGITGDPLFVKSGRGIVATEHALTLAPLARELLSSMQSLAQSGEFDPAGWNTRITIAANDLQRDLLLPGLMQRLRQSAPGLRLQVIPSEIPSAEILRNEHCQLILSPRPPDASDVVQKRLFEDQYRVFYDASVRPPPRSRSQYLQSGHVTVVYQPRRALDLDQWLEQQGVQRDFQVTVPGFAGVPPFILGTEWLCTAPSYLARHLFARLDSVKVPLPCPPLPMFMVWHLRHQHHAAHQWLRRQVEAVAQQVLGNSPPLTRRAD